MMRSHLKRVLSLVLVCVLLVGVLPVSALAAISGSTTVEVNGTIKLTSNQGGPMSQDHEWTYTTSDGGSVSISATNNGKSASVTGQTAGTVTITHRYKNSQSGSWQTETYTVTVTDSGSGGGSSSNIVTVYVFVAGYDYETKQNFSDDMLKLLNVNTLDGSGYFAAGTLELDLSQLSGTTDSMITSEEEWKYVLNELAENLDESASITCPNNLISLYAQQVMKDTGVTQNQGYSGLWLAGGHSNITEVSGSNVGNQFWHLDLRFETVNITYITGNNKISSGTYQDNTQLSNGVFISGVTLTKDFEPENVAPEGYTFAGFYEDANFTTEWSGYGYPITKDTTVYVKYEKITTDVTVSKEWDDGDNQDGLRPDSVSVTLSGSDGSTYTGQLTATNGWAYTFEDIPAYSYNDNGVSAGAITYTAQETNVPTGYTASYSSDKLTITNSHTPETTSVTVNKVWDDNGNQDGTRTSYAVTITGTVGEGEEKETVYTDTQTLAATATSYTWESLDKYSDGEEIVYTVEETSVPTGYAPEVTGSADEGFTITNKYTPETTEVKVTKEWSDGDNQDGIRPASVTVTLMNGTTVVDTVVLSDSNGWTHTFTNLAKYNNGTAINYTVVETGVPTTYTSATTGNATDGYTIINTHTPETIQISVEKKWDDGNNQDGIRPTTVTVDLMNGDTVVDTVTLSDSNSWSGTFKSVDKYSNGTEISYTLKEVTVSGYTVSVTGNASAGYTITNTHTPETTTISGTKTWDDGGDQDGKRPSSITIRLYADGEELTNAVKTVTESENWSWSFTGLPKYSNGKEIVYTITEDAVTDYTSTVSGYNVTNSYTPGKTSVTVTKNWDDADNQDGIRPTSVTVELVKNDTETGKTVTLTADNNWTNSFTDLDEYTNGTKNAYTVKEVSVTGYTSAITGNATTGYTITNSHTPETISISVNKVWSDNENAGKTRPEEVTVTLYANGQTTGKTLTLNESNSWTSAFTNLDKCANGKAIEYTVKEDAVTGYDSEITENDNGSFTITNTLKETPVEPTKSLSVDKELKSVNGSDYTSGSKVQVGDVLTYTITVTNTGNTSLTGITVKDTINGDGTITVGTLPADVTYENNVFTIPSLAEAGEEGSSVIITYTYKVADSDAGKTITNTAVAKVENDPEVPEDEGKTEVTVEDPGLSVVKTLTEVNGKAYTSGKVEVGDELTYTITVTNTGDTTLTGITVTDELPSGLREISNNTETINTLIPKASVTFTVVAKVLSSAEGKTLTNTAVATASDGTKGTGTEDVTVYDEDYTDPEPTGATLSITKTISGTGADEDDEFELEVYVKGASGKYTYTYKLGNTSKTKTVTFSSKGYATLTIEPNATITIKGLPYKAEYSVEEVDSGDYTVTYTNESGKLKTGTTKVTINNHLSATPDLNTEDHYSYIIGYTDGTVQPEGNLTRAEAATIFFRLLTDDARETYWSQANPYTDVSIDDWYNNAISTLYNMGIISGYTDGTFQPNEPITRAELTKIAVSFFEYADGAFTYHGQYTDVDGSEWYADFVAAATELGLINGYTDGTFQPQSYITRAETCAIVNRTLGRNPDADHLLARSVMNTWPDNATTAWYYADIQEATNSHDYEWIVDDGETVEDWTAKLEDRDWAALEKSWSTAYSAPGGEVMG